MKGGCEEGEYHGQRTNERRPRGTRPVPHQGQHGLVARDAFWHYVERAERVHYQTYVKTKNCEMEERACDPT